MLRNGRTHSGILWALNRGYCVDVHGTVWLPRGVPCKQRKAVSGRWVITVGPGNTNARIPLCVHALIGFLKFGDQVFEPGMCLRHLDNNPDNNAWKNIGIGTQHDNMMDRPSVDRCVHAQRAANTTKRLTDAEVRRLRKDRAQGMTYRLLGQRYKIAKSTISYILSGRTYKSVQ